MTFAHATPTATPSAAPLRLRDRSYRRPFVRFTLPYEGEYGGASEGERNGLNARSLPRPQPATAPRVLLLLRAVATSRAAAYGLVLAAAVLWGFSSIATKDVLDAGVGAFEIAFWRMLLGGGLFVFHAGCRGDLKLRSRSDAGPLVGFALFVVALNFVAFNVAIERGGVSLVNLFLASVPILVVLGAWLLLGERLTLWKAALGALSAAGLVLVTVGGGQGVVVDPVSLGATLIATLTVVVYTIAGKRLLRRYSPAALNACVMPLGALMLLPFVDFGPKTPLAWLLLVLLAVFPTYAADLFYLQALERLEASRVAVLVNVEAVTALAAAALLFGERLTLPGLLGVVLILGVSVLVALPAPALPAPLGDRHRYGLGSSGGSPAASAGRDSA